MSKFTQHHDQRTLDKEPEFNNFIEAALSRRRFLKATGAAGTVGFFAATPLSQAVAKAASAPSYKMSFNAITISTADTIEVPQGYQADVLVSWGDPIFKNAPAFSQKANSKAQEMQFGDNNDGMTFFPLSDTRAVLAVNNEYTNNEYLYEHQGKNISADDARKAQAAHGVSIVELVKKNGKWQINIEGRLNRRITAFTEMEMTGPAAGHDLLKTAADKSGKKILGTFNNCANGQTPWGTYLTCEENFNGYFASSVETKLGSTYKRYGLKDKDWGYDWFKHDERFDLGKHPNEPHRFGWVVEIDPMNPNSTPKKRSALGRFKHENAALTVNDDGHVVVYLGDDERGEHLYKFVSKNKYKPGADSNRDLLEEGTLYVAKFDGKEGELGGKGQWLELTWGKNGLTPENGFPDAASVMIFARMAATQVGGTTMDRPEWVAVHADQKSVFCTLTNNKYRGVRENQPVNVANPRVKNPYGHIVRWRPTNGDHTANTFDWDIYVLAGNPEVHESGLMAGSDNINKDNMFNSPDGIGFDLAGRLWIQTDGKYSNKGDFAGMGNNQMLCGDTETGEIRRFLTGPIACEITGLTFTPDYKTMFVGVQHPGEDLAPSHFPDGGDSIPRSSVIAITRKDGGVIGA
ncbi:PhoX family protein [Vibrio nigripulchritudo]|uniref:PhoX family protein n=1 Tax=Vibrio nigripulchritudo TaxID=28173 RepID=UPI00248F8FD8|nr:PhoX family phosphatase [Vibrio nigripulchritudo]BDU36957.1 transcriptional initiation protein Tat [Vibrio nigripulchritudo]BDU42667.1 transcriptional initiation protein Tat [Vibrio nigripulchritudo]